MSKELGVELVKKRLRVDADSSLELDGYAQSPLVLCEAWAHVGPVKVGQKQKVMTDAMKLLYANAVSGGDGRLILLFADPIAAGIFQGNAWVAKCLTYFGIEVHVIDMGPELKTKIREAQERQVR